METLLQIPDCSLHRASAAAAAPSQAQQPSPPPLPLAAGPLTLRFDPDGDDDDAHASVGDYAFLLSDAVTVSRPAPCVYVFAPEDEGPDGGADGGFLCLVLPADTPREAVEALEEVLSSLTAFADGADDDDGGGDGGAAGAGPTGAGPSATSVAAAAETHREAHSVRGAAPAATAEDEEAAAPPSEEEAATSSAAAPLAAAAASAPRPFPGSLAGATGKAVFGLQFGAHLLSAGILKTAELAAGGLGRAADFTVARTQPAARPLQPSAGTLERVGKAKAAAGTAARVSGQIAGGVGNALGAVAGAVAGRIAATGPMRRAAAAHPNRFGAARAVGRAGVDALADILSAMDAAGRSIAAATGAATTKVVAHKYGQAAGQLSREGFVVLGDCVVAVTTIRGLRARKLLKRTARKTASRLAAGGAATAATAGVLHV